MLRNLNGINPIFYLFAIIAVWDAVTTLFGTVIPLGVPTVGSLVAGLLVSLSVASLIFMTFEIWSDSTLRENGFLRRGVRSIWFLAVVYDLVTSFYGNATLMEVKFSEPTGIFVLSGMTVLLAFSSFMAAFLYDKHRRGKVGVGDY